MPRYELPGRVALITGGAQGIGFATARAIHARGATVAIVDLRQEAADRAAAQIDGEAIGLAADVSDREAIRDAVEIVVERRGGLDVVVANAGIAAQPATARAIDEDAFERVIDVNLLGVWRTVRAALPEILRRKGHVVVVSSVFAFSHGMGAVPYAMSKAGVEQLGRALRAELVQHGASASVAYFGFVDTEMVHEAINRDPLAARMMATFPRALRKRLPADAAGEAIAEGIERRAPRVIRPRRWAAMSALRGLINPMIDARAERDTEIQTVLAELDRRADERTPTTA